MSALPSTIPNLVVWLKADAACYQDLGMTTPCTDATDCAVWVDQAASVQFTQSNASRRPTWYGTGQNNKPYLSFASGEGMESVMGPYSQPVTSFFALYYLGVTSAGNWITNTAGGGITLSNNASNPHPYIYAGGSSVTSTQRMDTGGVVIISTRHDGTDSLLRINHVAGITPPCTNIGSNALQNMFLMSAAGGAYYMNGYVYEICMYNRQLDSTEIATVEDYLGARYQVYPNSDSASQPSIPDAATIASGVRKLVVGTETYTYGARKETTDGSPLPPSFALDYPLTSYRWRWGVKSGTRTLQLAAKQVSNVTGKRPRVIVRANPSIGVTADISADAPDSADWTTIGPITVNPTANGVLWVELWNMDTDNNYTPALFDHIVTT